LPESLAVAVGARLAEIAVDDDDPIEAPAQGDRPFAQAVLALRALGYEGIAASARAWLEVACMGYLFARLRVEPA